MDPNARGKMYNTCVTFMQHPITLDHVFRHTSLVTFLHHIISQLYLGADNLKVGDIRKAIRSLQQWHGVVSRRYLLLNAPLIQQKVPFTPELYLF